MKVKRKPSTNKTLNDTLCDLQAMPHFSDTDVNFVSEKSGMGLINIAVSISVILFLLLIALINLPYYVVCSL